MSLKIKYKIAFIILLSVYLSGNQEFKLVEKWHHDDIMSGILFDAVVDQDGDLITAFQKAGVIIANAKKIEEFAPFGQGPNDLDGFFTLCFYKGDLAVEGMAGKLKVFHKKEGKYSWKQTIWKKFGITYHHVKDGQFAAGKWFFSGPQVFPIGKNKFSMYYVNVYEEDGKIIKSLLRKDFKKSEAFPFNLLEYYIEKHKGNIYFIAENEPVIKIISPQSLKVMREIKLEMPAFYRPMPEENYRDKKKNKRMDEFEIQKKWAEWKTNYSRICRTAVDGNQLVLQIRTSAKALKRYALLLYNVETFKLDRTVMTDDLLLAVKDKKYYMFANGNPAYDDEAGEYIINIYQFKDKK
jgi:hypothetical protein